MKNDRLAGNLGSLVWRRVLAGFLRLLLALISVLILLTLLTRG